MAEENVNNINILPEDYGCNILLEKTSIENVKDPSFPTNAYLVWYTDNGKECLDLTSCSKMVNIFDMYYDKYGSGGIKKIEWGYGKTNPKMWGYTKKQSEKKRK